MLVTLLVKLKNKDCKITELGLLLQVLPVRIVTFVETLGSHHNCVIRLGTFRLVRADNVFSGSFFYIVGIDNGMIDLWDTVT